MHGLVKVLCQWGWGGGLQDPETTLWFMCLWVNVDVVPVLCNIIVLISAIP